jgi:hypothetical protein
MEMQVTKMAKFKKVKGSKPAVFIDIEAVVEKPKVEVKKEEPKKKVK